MSFWQSISEKLFSSERRRASRKPTPELSAFFWTGAAPLEHSIRDISSTGLFLVTEERWYLGTLVMMTLQKRSEPVESPERSIAVQCKAVRYSEDGVGLQFILPEMDGHRRGQNLLEGGVDRKTLDKFLKGLKADEATARVERIGQPRTR